MKTLASVRMFAVPPLLIAVTAAVVMLLAGTQADAEITHGSFEDGWYTDGDDLIPCWWTKFETQMGAGGEPTIIWQSLDNGPSEPGTLSVHWTRTGGGGSGDWTVIEQELNLNIQECGQLWLCVDIKAIYHNLGGSGWTPDNWEFPVTLLVYFTDTNGVDRYWQFGWYLWIDEATAPAPNGYVTPSGAGIVYSKQVQGGVWHAEGFNLLAHLRTLAEPQTITKIRIGGTGWDFEGKADNIRMSVVGPTLAQPTTWGSLKALYMN